MVQSVNVVTCASVIGVQSPSSGRLTVRRALESCQASRGSGRESVLVTAEATEPTVFCYSRLNGLEVNLFLMALQTGSQIRCHQMP